MNTISKRFYFLDGLNNIENVEGKNFVDFLALEEHAPKKEREQWVSQEDESEEYGYGNGPREDESDEEMRKGKNDMEDESDHSDLMVVLE
jgi:hypothetical protein